MPVYEYRCADCGQLTSVFTRKQGFEGSVQCSGCGGGNTSRAISSFAFSKSSGGSDFGDFGEGDDDLGGMGGMPGMGGMGGMGGHGHSHGGDDFGGLDMGDDF